MNKIVGKITLLSSGKAIGLAIIAGAITALGLAPFHIMPIVFVTIPIFICLLDATRDKHYKYTFFIGWAFGFGYFTAGLWWIANATLVEADKFAWLVPLAAMGIPAGLAIYWGIAAVIVKMLVVNIGAQGWRRILGFAIVFAIIEYARANLFTGFAWNTFGYIFVPETILMQATNVIGIHGVTFFAFFIAATPVMLLTKEKYRGRMMAIAVLLLCVQTIYGLVSIKLFEHGDTYDTNIRLVQPNIKQKDKLNSEKAVEIFRAHINLSKENNENVDFIIWPESAFPFLIEQQPLALAEIDKMMSGKTKLIAGAVRRENNGGKIFNSTLVFDSQARVIAKSDKIRLVPFGEFLPFHNILEKIGFSTLTQSIGSFDRGQRKIIEVDNMPAFMALICYEIIFSGDIYDAPKWIVNLTNDAWFGHSTGPYQHAHQAIVRGVEMGVPVVRVANTGISFIANANGKIVNKLNFNQKGTINAKLPRHNVATIFSIYKDISLIIISCIAIVIMLWGSSGNRTLTSKNRKV